MGLQVLLALSPSSIIICEHPNDKVIGQSKTITTLAWKLFPSKPSQEIIPNFQIVSGWQKPLFFFFCNLFPKKKKKKLSSVLNENLQWLDSKHCINWKYIFDGLCGSTKNVKVHKNYFQVIWKVLLYSLLRWNKMTRDFMIFKVLDNFLGIPFWGRIKGSGSWFIV